MKNTIIIVIIVFAAFISMVKTFSQETNTEEVVLTGCIGDCGVTRNNNEYTVNAECNVLMVARTTETSLCPNTGVYGFLFKNGKEVASGHMTKKNKSLQTKAAPGDKIVVYLMEYPLFNNIQCIRQGNLNYQLIKKNTR